MKKVIFEGTVDGVKFDNVEAYNKALTKAMAEGKNVQASSSTKVLDSSDNDTDQKPEEALGTIKPMKPILTPIFPGFELDPTSKDYENVIFKNLNDYIDGKLNISDVIGSVRRALEKVYDITTEQIMADKEGEFGTNYIDVAGVLMEKISQVAEKNRERIDHLNEEIKKCNRKNYILNEYLDYYENILDLNNPDDEDNGTTRSVEDALLDLIKTIGIKNIL